MNTCKHCGFTGESEEFRRPKGKVCKECYNKCRRERRKNNHKQIIKQEGDYRKKNRKRINKQAKEFRENNPGKFIEYGRKYRNKNREEINKCEKERRDENREEFNKRERERYRNNRAKHGILPWTEVKSLRLGLYIEQTIARVFGSVAEPYGTPDIDFICPQGYKIQVKVSSLGKNEYPNWNFGIKKNKVADYFVLVAVNNIDDIDKENFKPAHMWMMEGDVLNDKTGTSVSPSTISKWDEYSIKKGYKNKFINCCKVMKKDKG